jgi:hypothetical protein
MWIEIIKETVGHNVVNKSVSHVFPHMCNLGEKNGHESKREPSGYAEGEKERRRRNKKG